MGWQYQKGIGQGVLNTANGVQDIGVGLVNLGIQTSPLGQVMSLTGNSLPTIESPDWSRGKITDESDFGHSASKFLGGNGAVTLATLGLGNVLQISRQRRQRKLRFQSHPTMS